MHSPGNDVSPGSLSQPSQIYVHKLHTIFMATCHPSSWSVGVSLLGVYSMLSPLHSTLHCDTRRQTDSPVTCFTPKLCPFDRIQFINTTLPVCLCLYSGCEVEILGVRPALCEEYIYNPSIQNLTHSIESALNAISLGKANMGALYYEKIDVEGHHFGPDSPEVSRAVQELDGAMQEKGLEDKLNVVMFSDHGMTRIQWMDKVIELDKYLNMSDITKFMDRGPVVSLWPKRDKQDQVRAALGIVPNMRVYSKADVLKRFHYGGGRFVSPLTLVAEPGWFIIQNKSVLPYWKNESSGPALGWQNGWHGYDNEYLDMRGFFLAAGPDFKKNVRAAPIRSVDVYNLMCRTLGIEPLPNNGSWSRVEYLLSGAGIVSYGWVVLVCSALPGLLPLRS
uniref:glycerophosphocholine cholinephosphodiesterase n=1 Tax=Periophthalmus magnuspinnatus TaxID=409849 RepID=A0A3B4BJI9_9GOBI